MRENWARLIVFLTGLLVLVLAYIFAVSQNPENIPLAASEKVLPQASSITSLSDADLVKRGQAVFVEQNCRQCHSFRGKGNPVNPLDGKGKTLSAVQLRDGITGAGSTEGKIPEGIRKLKQTYNLIAREDLNALMAYLQSEP